VIRSFSHKGLQDFFEAGSKAGIRPEHAKRLRLMLAKLNTATAIRDMNFPGGSLHPLHGDQEGFWAVSVSGNWRLVFRFDKGDACDVDYLDYH
jgi:proteic killer suppression protein